MQTRKHINNFDLIKDTLVFDSDDEFYFLQILKRKKENPDIGSNSQVIQTYYITSIEGLERRMPEIALLCDFHNARAYINLNRRSFEQMAYQSLKKTVDQIMNKDFYSVRRAYNSALGGANHEPKKSKKWVVDIDTKDRYEISLIEGVIVTCDPDSGGVSKTVAEIPTKNGIHLISTPFNVKQITNRCNELVEVRRLFEVPDIQKNNPTILYMPL